MPIKTASAKQKGRKLQQLVRDKLTDLLKPWGVVAEDIKSTAMGQSGEDVQFSPFAKKLLPITVECKAHKSFAVYKMYEQGDKRQGERVLVLKADNKKPLAVVDFEYYLTLEKNRIENE